MGPNGIQIAEQEQLRILQEQKAKDYANEAKAAKEKESTLYDRERDFSFLKICRYGQVTINPPSNLETKNYIPFRASTQRNTHASFATSLGQKPCERISSSKKMQQI